MSLSAVDRLQLRHDWVTIHFLNELLAETETQIAQLSVIDPWDESMMFLMQLPSIGLYTGMTILAAIGDIERFPSPQQLVGYDLLTRREVDRYADPQAVACSLMRWSSLYHLARSQDLHRLDFVKQRLDRLGLLPQISSFRANGRIYYLSVPA